MMKKIILILSCLFLSVGLIYSQTIAVSGVVVDDAGEEVVGASVVVKGTTTGVATDIDGKFSLNVPSNSILVFSLVGMKKMEIKATVSMNVVMSYDDTMLSEMVVVAYGTQTARTIASSISTVRSESLKDVPNTSVDQMLQGRASGVQVTTPSAGLGQSPVIRVRGVNSITSGTEPLYVVDGLPIESGNVAQMGSANALASINPTDIVSMEILKDAAAASMYGSRAANGVVLITTKKGAKGRAKVSYDTYYGFQVKSGFYEMMNANEYVDFKNMALVNRYGTSNTAELIAKGVVELRASSYGDNVFNLMKRSDGSIVDTDWSKTAFQSGFTNSHSLSVSGGADQVQYFTSVNYLEQDGIVKGDKNKRLGLKANVTADATKWLKVGINVNTTSEKTSYVDAARNGQTWSIGGFPRLALINSPNIPAYNEDGTPYGSAGGLGYLPNAINNPFSNPALILAIGNGIDVEVNRVITNLFGEVTPMKGLVLKTQFGLDHLKSGDDRFWSPRHGDGVGSHGSAARYETTIKRWTWSNTATYDFSYGENHFNILAGMEANSRKMSYWSASRSDLQDDKMVGFEGPFATATSDGNEFRNTLASFFGRVNYDFAYKYILSLNYRRDGYSALGKNNRWGDFGGASIGYRLSDENFFEPLKQNIQDFKIKASVGVVGNTSGIGDYASRTYYTGYYYGTGGTYHLGSAGDENLKWESSTKYDLGFTTSFLDRFTMDFDYYLTQSNDLILNVPQAPSKGVPGNYITTNIGKMQNSGVEVSLTADILKGSEFGWSSTFNIATNKNKVKSLARGIENILGGDDAGYEYTNITVPGKSIGQLYLYPTAGVDSKTGRRVFIGSEGERVLLSYDVNPITGKLGTGELFWNEDGTVFEGDLKQEMAGGTLPTWYGGWSNNFNYKNFDLSIFFQFSGGNKIYNGTAATVSDMRYWNNAKEVLNNYWTKDNTNAKYPIPVYGDNYSNGSNLVISDWVEKGDYLRLKNVSLGYTFNTNSAWANKIGISALRVYAQAQNLFVITGYSGMDPEVLTNVLSTSLSAGTDKNTLPQAKTYTFGLSLTF